MVNEVSKKVKAMKEEVSTLQKNVEKIFKEELQRLDSMELKREN